MAERSLLIFSGCVLLFAAVAKATTHLVGGALAPWSVDPIFLVDAGALLAAAAGTEIAITVYLYFGGDRKMKLSLIAWVSSAFLAYRLGLRLVGLRDDSCGCVGSLARWVGTSQKVEERILSLCLIVMLVSSAFLLLGGTEAAHRARALLTKICRSRWRASAVRLPFGSEEPATGTAEVRRDA